MIRRDRRGSYAVLMGLLLVLTLSLAALVIDWGRARIAGGEAQTIADAAAQAAVMALKRTGSLDDAQDAATLVTGRNRVAGLVPDLLAFEAGGWDANTHTWSTSGQNAVRVSVGRAGTNALTLPLASLMGFDSVEVRRSATAATVNLQVVLVMDITGSWDKDDFAHARTAAVSFLDLLHNAHGADDLVGMTLFLQRFGWEYTPFTSIVSSATNPALVRTPWSALNVGSYAGSYQSSWESDTSKHVACRVYGTNNSGRDPWSGWCTSGSSCYRASLRNNFTSPAGGCFASMPRYYSDEGGTDHTTGMRMARTMFQDRPDPFAYRAMIVLTDGKPNGYSSTSGATRTSQGYNETRYREYRYSGAHSSSQIETDTVTLAQQMHDEDHVNIWFISFVEYRSFMERASQGDGYFRLAPAASELEEIFQDIARSLPVTVVE